MADYKHTLRIDFCLNAIYVLMDEGGVPRYIGKSKNILARLRSHQKTKPWIASCLVVEWCSDGEWADREKFWITDGRGRGWPLLNRASGGQGGGYQLSELHKAKISRALRSSQVFAATRARGDSNGSRLHPERVPRGARHGSVLHPESRAFGDKNGMRKHPESVLFGKKHWARLKPELLKRGEANPLSKLDAAKVREIVSLLKAGVFQRNIAKAFGVSQGTISHIRAGAVWAHITGGAINVPCNRRSPQGCRFRRAGEGG